MDTTQFDADIGGLTSSLGDPTRRGIYVAVRESPEPLTVAAVASLFGIHPNVARHHLERLVDDGYLKPSPRAAGRRAGRPAKRYEATGKEIVIEYPARRYDLLSELLVKVAERLDPGEASRVAEEVGREYGAQLAAEIGLPDDPAFGTAVTAVARAMSGLGFAMQESESDHTLITHSCPFGQTALNHPDVVCKLDQGIVAGLLGTVGARANPVVIPHGSSGEVCFTDL